MASLGFESIGILVPRLYGKDGESIALGQTRYGEDGVKYTITGLGTEYVWGRADGSKIDKRLKPEWLTSKRPDSWGQLERDLMAIARCRDCKYYRHYDRPTHRDWCLRGSGDYCVQVYPNGFCAWGERRDDD